MTDERPQDERVTASYRELAGERAPAHLDQKILELAASHASHADYARSVNWTRPLAWAATIVLCLAITLELTRVPTPEEIADRPVAEPEEPAAVGLTEKLESAADTDDAFRDDREQPTSSRYKRAEDVAAATAPAAAATAFEIKSNDAPILRQAEEMARLQSGTNAEKRAASPRCADDVRAKPESWLRCIEELEEIGDHEAALVERESLVAVFPDFRLP